MTTRYQCKKCGIVFEGHDPVYFGSLPEPSYPWCPNNAPTLPLTIGGARPVEEHMVSLAVIAVTDPPPNPAFSAWETKRVNVAERPEEMRQRKVQAKRDARQKKLRDDEEAAAAVARRLVSLQVATTHVRPPVLTA